MRKSRRGGENVDTAMETLAEQALAAMDSVSNGSGASNVEAAIDPNSHEAPPESSEIAVESGTEAREEALALEEDTALKAILEALLFVSPEPLSVERCVSAVGQVSKAEVREAFALLEHEYLQRGGALQLVQVAGGYRIVTKPQFASWIRRLEKAKAQVKLSRSAVEALAIIAIVSPLSAGSLKRSVGLKPPESFAPCSNESSCVSSDAKMSPAVRSCTEQPNSFWNTSACAICPNSRRCANSRNSARAINLRCSTNPGRNISQTRPKRPRKRMHQRWRMTMGPHP